MEDRAVAVAIVAGDPDGVAAAYDQYGASLYAYCRSLLPGPQAADAVRDTFMIAVGRLDGLRDPDRLGDWLHAVARNECWGSRAPRRPRRRPARRIRTTSCPRSRCRWNSAARC